MADKSLTIFDRLLDEEKQEEKPETIFDRLLREEGEQEEKEERYRVAGLTSQPLPTLPPPTEEDKKSSADIDREQAAAAREFFKAGEVKEEEDRELKHREQQLGNLDRYREITRKYSDLRERSKVKGSERELKGETDELLREMDEFESASGLGYYDFGLTLKQINEKRVQGSRRQRESATSKISPGKEPSLYQKFRRLESTRSLFGPEVGLLDYKPLGSKIDKLGLIPAMFEPVDEVRVVGNYLRIAPKKGRGDAASVGAALWNTAVGLAEVIGGSPGGVATMGLGGALGAASKTGRAYEAERVLALGESAFAVDLARNAAEHAPGLMRDLEDPDLLGQEKAEALMGEAALLVFSGMSGAKAKKNFKKKYGIEPDKIKTREQARIAYERFLDQTAVERLDPKLRKTSKQIQEAQIESLIKEMQDKVDRGKFRVPRPKPLEKGLPIQELKAEEPPTPVEARLVTREEAREAADTQRNIPEDAMLEVTKEIEGSTLSELLEHVGDISNRAQKDAGGGAAKLGMIEKFGKAERQGDLGLEGSIRSDLEYEGAHKYVNERPDLKKLKDAGEGSKEWADAGIERISDIYRDAWADTEYLNKYVDGRLLEIKTILEPYVEAHKLHNKPVTEMGVLGKQLAIDLGEMNFDALRATSKKLRALYDEYNAAKTPEAKDQVWLRRATIEEAPKPPTPVEAEGLDVAYDRAVKAGDRAAQKALVDEAAKAAGYGSRVYHGSDAKFTEFDMTKASPGSSGLIFFSTNPKFAKYGKRVSPYFLKGETRVVGERGLDRKTVDGRKMFEDGKFADETVTFDGETRVVGSPNQIKSAALIVRDNTGNVIPLSERFGLKAPKPPTPVEAEFGKSAELEPEAVSSIRDQFRKGAKVYRGTGYKAPADPGDLGSGRYSSSLKERAANYGTRVEELEIKLKNPLILSEGEAYARIADRFGTVTGENRAQAAASAMEAVKAQGYDGIVSVGKDGSWEVVDYAPKPPTEGYLEPPATALEAMKRDAAAAKAAEIAKNDKLLQELKAEQETPALEEAMKAEEAPTPTEGLTKPPRTEEQMIKAAEREAAEIDAAKALKDEAKIEETITESALEESLLTEYMKNRKVQKFHKTIKRHMDGADSAEKARWAENPDSAYDVVPTSSWAKAIEKMSMEEIEADLSKNKAAIPQLGPELIVKSMLENKKAQILKKRWRESKSDADWMEYESFVQELANPKTFAGQYIQAQRHFKAGDPIIEADVIAAAILNHKGPKLSKADRAKLIELIDKSMEAKEKADKAAEEYWKDESDANWEKATKTLDLSEVATINQIEFIANKSPKAVVDMLVATLQGNFLTPTTLMVNVAGNIAPLGPRALARIPARGLDMAEQFFMRDRRIAEREMLIERQKENPSVEVAARIEKLDKMLSPMEQIRLKPIEGTKEKLIGGWEGSGLPRVLEAIKKTREEGGSVKDLLENFRGGKKSTLGMDSAGAIILGEQLNKAMLIEVGEMDMSSMTPSLDAASAAKRLLNTLKRKRGREVEGPESVKAISDLYEVTFGLSPTVFFRALAGGDIPFRNAELRRLIAEQAEIRKWSKEKLGRALERPSLIFNPKEWASLQFKAAQATFQHENRGTRAVQRFNKFLRGESLTGEAAYLIWRDMTPYQKTLININAELLNFTPFGLADVLLTANKNGFMSREAKISAGKVITGTTAMLVAARYLNNDIMSHDQDPGMSETGDQRSARYMTEETYHHGFINWDAAMRDMKGEDTAWKPGDYISDARRMGQFGYLLLNGANYHRSLEMMPKEDREKLSSSWNTLLKFTGESVQYSAKYAINQSFATGVRDKLRAVSRAMDADTGSDALKPIAGVLLRDAMTIPVPNTLGWWSKAGSPYKQTFKSDELSQTLKDGWVRKTGMWKEDYPIIVDLWGTPLESMPRGTLYPGGLAKHKDTAEGKIDRLDRLMAVSFNIFRFKKSGTIMDPYSAEVYRLWRKFPKGNVVPPIPSPRITLDGVEYKLNRDQYAYYSAMTGRYRLSGTGSIAPSGPTELELSFDKEDGWGVRQFISKGEPFMLDGVRYKDYMDVPDEIKAEEFKKIYRKATTAGKNMFADWEKHKGTPRFDSIMKMYSINPKNLPLTEDQIKKEPSGRAD